MLTKEDNDLITNTDPGTPMGDLFRRFWLPVALSEELPAPDGIPVRVKVLNEDLIAFRDTDGKVGLIDAYCPHRGAPMFFGRNEEQGLRCVYHGWKFDVNGECVDLPSAPEGETYREKINIVSYPTVDAGGLIWAYMGPKDREPPFPNFEWTKVPAENRYIKKFRLECNYMQAMEGDFDPSHARFLHSTLEDVHVPNPLNPAQAQRNNPLNGSRRPEDDKFPRAVGNRRVVTRGTTKLEDSDSGVIAVTTTDLPDGKVRADLQVSLMLPIFCTAGIGGPNTHYSNIRVPIDNKSLMFYRLRWSFDPIPDAELQEYMRGGYYYPELVPGTWQTEANVTNDYLIDREKQRDYNYTGIKTFPLQDIAMMENQWGPIADRRKEHLTSLDYQIIHVRQRLLKAAKALVDGVEPTEPWHPEAYCYRRGSAIGDSAEEAIRNAREACLAPKLGEVVPPIMVG
ncbi:MAG TPA: Rieske 2Fe-2S domain-containing protein [Dehalococcoidia bacterium]|nr:Rieske 2Fe-2S domain-containing protein [Dehalococcoidia bacterium]